MPSLQLLSYAIKTRPMVFRMTAILEFPCIDWILHFISINTVLQRYLDLTMAQFSSQEFTEQLLDFKTNVKTTKISGYMV